MKETFEVTAEQLNELITDCVNDAIAAKEQRDAAAKRPTKESILAIKDKYQRQKAISENLDLF